MELYQLRTFVAVIEAQSISGAARRLSMTPSSVSTHIKALESELGVQLFVRTHQGVEVTDKGQILAEHARQTLHAANGLSQQANVLKQQVVGTLRLGLSVSASVFDLAPFIQVLNYSHPELELHLTHSESASIVHQLRDDALDIGIVFGHVDDMSLMSHSLGQVDLVIAIPAAWMDRIDNTWASLGNLAWINTGDDCPFQPLIHQVCLAHNLHPQQLLRTDNDQTRQDLVRAGMGVSLLVQADANHPDIMIFKSEPITCEVSVVYPAHRQFDPMIQAGCGAILQH